ncbi:unnamed protein product, partial [Closterium sp. NIES-53]
YPLSFPSLPPPSPSPFPTLPPPPSRPSPSPFPALPPPPSRGPLLPFNHTQMDSDKAIMATIKPFLLSTCVVTSSSNHSHTITLLPPFLTTPRWTATRPSWQPSSTRRSSQRTAKHASCLSPPCIVSTLMQSSPYTHTPYNHPPADGQ